MEAFRGWSSPIPLDEARRRVLSIFVSCFALLEETPILYVLPDCIVWSPPLVGLE